ncbi:MAG: hypothetical protein ABIV28_03605 [Longimicrobiales bacterium]
MRFNCARTILIMGIAIAACGGSETNRSTTARNTDSTTKTVTAAQPMDSAVLHGQHAAPAAGDSGTAAAAAPMQHGGASMAGPPHAGGAMPAGADHATMPGMASAQHGQHAAAQTHANMAHADMSRMAHADTAHMAHADTAHMAHADTANMAHADTAHMAHADTAHMAHADTTPMAHDMAAMPGMGAQADAHAMTSHNMWMRPLGNGWNVMGMAQVFPIVTTSPGAPAGTSRDRTELYLTQPALMANIEAPGARVVLRTTLNLEGVTQPDGELTFGGWGEGFLDKRHPHTLLHEAMLSFNTWQEGGRAWSISAGKGFAPFGTDDPMSRPIVKYPTNHHLSQILERWTLSSVYLNGPWSVEAGLFGGAEPNGPYDLSNIGSFGDSWSARLARRFGSGSGPMADWEASASYGRVREVHDNVADITSLYNGAIRHQKSYEFGSVYGLVEGSVSRPGDGDGDFSLLGETRVATGRHQPYYRVEYATRPEYAREGQPGTDPFFRYDHDAEPIGATRWLINTAGYGYQLSGYPLSARPFVELQYNRVSEERGGIDPEQLFGARSFWGISAGFRLFLGGDPMRMGSYGVLDDMTSMHRGGAMSGSAPAAGHTGHQ